MNTNFSIGNSAAKQASARVTNQAQAQSQQPESAGDGFQPGDVLGPPYDPTHHLGGKPHLEESQLPPRFVQPDKTYEGKVFGDHCIINAVGAKPHDPMAVFTNTGGNWERNEDAKVGQYPLPIQLGQESWLSMDETVGPASRADAAICEQLSHIQAEGTIISLPQVNIDKGNPNIHTGAQLVVGPNLAIEKGYPEKMLGVTTDAHFRLEAFGTPHHTQPDSLN